MNASDLKAYLRREFGEAAVRSTNTYHDALGHLKRTARVPLVLVNTGREWHYRIDPEVIEDWRQDLETEGVLVK